VSPADGLRRRTTTVLIAATAVLLLSACRVELATTVNVAENGSGTITVVTTADADAVRAAPELADSLALDDVKAAGWEVTVQNPTADGGIAVTLTRPFSNTDEANVFLSQLSGESGPLRALSLTRSGGMNDTTYVFTGTGGLPSGLAGFADDDALAALGGAPFADAIAAQGTTLGDALSVSLRLTMPGTVTETNGETAPRASDDLTTSFSWSIPVDGTDVSFSASTQDRNFGALVASFAARGLLGLLVVLVAAAVVYLATVVQRRDRSTPSS